MICKKFTKILRKQFGTPNFIPYKKERRRVKKSYIASTVLTAQDVSNGIRPDIGDTDRSDISDDGDESDDGRRSSDGSRKRSRRVKEESEDLESESKLSTLQHHEQQQQQQPIKCDASQFSVPGEKFKARCHTRFQHAFSPCSCVFKDVTLVGSNKRNYLKKRKHLQ